MYHRAVRFVLFACLGAWLAGEARGEWFSRCVYCEDFEGAFPTNFPAESSSIPRRNPVSRVTPREGGAFQQLSLLPGSKTDPAIAWTSLPFRLETGRHYRLTFEAKTRAPILWGVSFRDAQGNPLSGDHNTGVEPCEEWTQQVYYFTAKYPGVEGMLSFFLLGQEPAAIDNICIHPASPAREREWYGNLAEQMRPLDVKPPAGAGKRISRSLAKLSHRGPFRIVFFGDSIANDISLAISCSVIL